MPTTSTGKLSKCWGVFCEKYLFKTGFENPMALWADINCPFEVIA